MSTNEQQIPLSPVKDLKITYETSTSSTRQITPVSGAFGAVSAQGQIIAHLFVEYQKVPNQGSFMVKAGDESVYDMQASVSKSHFVREVVSTVSMPPEVAIALGSWFLEQGKLAQALFPRKK